MPRICLTSGATPCRRPFRVLAGSSALLLLAAAACADNDALPLAPSGVVGRGGAGDSGGAPQRVAGAPATAGAGDSGSLPAVADAGGKGEPSPSATGGAAAIGEQNAAGAAGMDDSVSVGCRAGGPSFVVGNYDNAQGDQLLLRASATAETLALVPHGVASAATRPQLFLVERSCVPGGVLIVRDENAHYRLDFSRTGGHFGLCFSIPVASLEDAAALPAADLAHAQTTGCAGKPFSLFDAETR